MPEIRVEPGAVPAPKRQIDVAVIFGEPRAQIAGLVRLLGRCDRADRNIFHEKMRRDQHETARAKVLAAAGVNGGDRSAVAVADENRLAHARLVEHRGQDFAGLPVHIGEGPRQRDRIGLAVARSRIGQHPVAGALGKRLRELLPHRDRAEPLVQQHQGGRLFRRRPVPRRLDLFARNGED